MRNEISDVTKRVIVAYVPVLHQGYKVFFESNPSYHDLLILDDTVLDSDRAIQKDIRRLSPDLIRQSLSIWNVLDRIAIGTISKLKELDTSEVSVLMPDEDISHKVAKQYFPAAQVIYSPIFLRWDRRKNEANDPVDADSSISHRELDKELMGIASKDSRKSSDIWRRVGALLARDGKEIARSHNQARPTQHSSWLFGDPRNSLTKGVGIDKSVFIHAEAHLIAQAARNGTPLRGCDMYVTTFPCPQCAMLIAESGIKKLYFRDGYALLDGQSVLKSQGVKIIRVEVEKDQESLDKTFSFPYPEK